MTGLTWPAVAMAWVQYGSGRAVLVTLGFILIGMVVGSWMQRNLMQRRLDLSGGTIFIGATRPSFSPVRVADARRFVSRHVPV